MKKVLLFVVGFVLGVVSGITAICKFVKFVAKNVDEQYFVTGVKELIVCWVSSLLYGRPDHLYAKYDRRSYGTYKSYRNYNKEGSDA